jgi:hypothetical protein
MGLADRRSPGISGCENAEHANAEGESAFHHGTSFANNSRKLLAPKRGIHRRCSAEKREHAFPICNRAIVNGAFIRRDQFLLA